MNLEQSHKILKKLPTPWTIFLLIFSFFYLLPSTLLYLNFEKNLLIPDPVYQMAISFLIKPETLEYFFYSPLLFLIGYLMPIIILLILSLSLKQKSSKELLARNLEFQNPLFIQSKNFILLAGLMGAGISIFYFVFIALSMFSNLGGELSNAEFRFLLFDDRYRYFNLLLEIARRILLPIAVSFLMFQSLIFKYKEDPRIELITAFCDDKNKLVSSPDKSGVFRYTSSSAIPMVHNEYKYFCELDYTQEAQYMRNIILNK